MADFQLSSLELAKTNLQVNRLNKKINVNKHPETGKQKLGKDSFLKLLVTQLKHQDPTKPMEDKQFIAQMAQFSSLEQITNLNKEIRTLIRSSHTSEASSLLGKRVDFFNLAAKKEISGIVSSIKFDEGRVKLVVGSDEVGLNDIHAIHDVKNSSKK